MHFHFPFTTLQVLWTLTFAAHLVLLVVLMGRDRVRTFPWFTASIVLVALRLLVSQMLFGRLAQKPMAITFLSMACVGAFLSLMVVLELARRAFGGVRRGTWILGALGLLAVGAAVLGFYGALGLLIVLLGRRTGAGITSKVQQVAIGLMTASLSQLGIQLIWERIAKTAVAHSREEYVHILGIRDRLFNTNNGVYIAVLLWWIVCLWIEARGREQEAVTPVKRDLAGVAQPVIGDEETEKA
jgi:hypothetical protein